MRRTLFAGLALAFAAGCGARSPRLDAAPKLLEPAAIDDHVVFVDSNRAEARLLDVSGASAPRAPVVVPLAPNATHAEPRNGHPDELIVLCAGQPDVQGAAPAQPGLVVVGSDGKSTTYRYDSAFDRVVQSSDGKFAFLFFDPANVTNGVLKNPNEVAVIDLDAKNGTPSLKTLRSLGESPQSVVFSDAPVSIAGVSRSLAVVLLDKDFAVVDLSHLERSEYTVELTKPGVSSLSAAQVLFSEQEDTPKIYLRASGTDDVFVVSIEPRSAVAGGDAGTLAGDNDFALSFNQFGTGAGAAPSDIALFQDGGKTRLLVAAPGNSTAVVVDPDTGNTTTITLPASVSQIHLFTGPKPSDSTASTRALLYTPGGQNVVFLDLAGIGTMTNRAGNAEVLTLSAPYAKLTVLDDDTVMLLNQSNGLNLLKLGDRSLSPITGPNLVDAVPDIPVGKLWLSPSGDSIGYVDLANFHPNEVRLDASIEHVVRIPSTSKTNPKLLVTHPSSIGSLTVLDADTPADLAHAYDVTGYLIQNELQGVAR